MRPHSFILYFFLAHSEYVGGGSHPDRHSARTSHTGQVNLQRLEIKAVGATWHHCRRLLMINILPPSAKSKQLVPFRAPFITLMFPVLGLGKPKSRWNQSPERGLPASCSLDGWSSPGSAVLTGGAGAGPCRETGPSGHPGCETAWEQCSLSNQKDPSTTFSSGNPSSKGLSSTVQLALLTALNKNPLGLRQGGEGAGRDQAETSLHT